MSSPADFYASNLKLLKKNHPRLFETMNGGAFVPSGEITFNDNGHANLRITTRDGRHLALHDPYDPDNDVKPFLNIVPPNASGIAILFGIGLGYAALGLLQERPTLPYLAIFELDPGVFLQALKSVDLSPLLTSPKVLISIGQEPDLKALAPAEIALQLENIYTLRHLASYTAQEGYQALETEVFEHISSFNVEGATNIRFGRTFVANRLRHLSAIHHQHLIESLGNAFTGQPAILVAGGPSLDKNIHLLRQAQDKAIIFGVDSVLPTLVKAGIRPHFLTSIDPQELTYEKMANTPLNGLSVPLICMSWISPKVPKTFPAATVYWTFSAKPLEAWLNALLGGNTLTGGAGTVAHLNMLAAIIMGCSPIILIGQDLSFTPNRSSHTSGAFLTHDNKARDYVTESDQLITSPAWGGGETRTTRDFFGMKRFFERMIAENPRTYINATEGGVHLEGAEDLGLQLTLDRHCQRELNISATLDDRRCHAPKPDIARLLQEFKNVKQTIISLLKLIDKTDLTTQRALRELATAAKKRPAPQTFSHLPAPLRKKIQEIEVAHKTLDGHTQLWRLLEELTIEGLRDSERLRHEISPLANNPATYIKWLRASLNRCERINRTRKETLTYFDKGLNEVLEHHRQEQILLAAIIREGENETNLAALAELYMHSDDLTLATPVLDKLAALPIVSARTRFHQGVIALEQADYEKGDMFLAEAIRLDPDYAPQVDAFRRELGDRYLKHANFYRPFSTPVAKRLLLKGVRYCPDHDQIAASLRPLFNQEAQQATTALVNGNPAAAGALTAPWLADLDSNSSLATILGYDKVASLHFLHGQILTAQRLDNDALVHLSKALVFAPTLVTAHIQLMQIHFAHQQFQEGIEHLKKAVSLDRSQAAHWEEIGDTMVQSEMREEAISAYEQCFLALPGNTGLLKKIGDCYLALNQLEAARAAYEKYKEALLASAPSSTPPAG